MTEVRLINQWIMGGVFNDDCPLDLLLRQVLGDTPGGQREIVQVEGGAAIGQAAGYDQSTHEFSGSFVLGFAGQFLGQQGVLNADDVVSRVLGRAEEDVLESNTEKGEELLLIKVDVF